MSRETDVVEMLDFAANHFSQRDWEWSRFHNIDAIYYKDDDKLWKRFKWTLHMLSQGENAFFRKQNRKLIEALKGKIIWFLVTVKINMPRENHLPDGALSGGVIAHWEEDGEYVQMVQPSVGNLLAQFLKEQPDNPHAKLITEELVRISDGYQQRAKRGEVDGRIR